MTTFKQSALLAFGLFAALHLGAAHAQREHDEHHPQNAPNAKADPHATQPKPQQGGMMQGMDHDQMMQMHDEHMGNGHMDHGMMGHGDMSHDQMNRDMPEGAEQGQPHDH